jgi:CelD/BcsL family acetyltransferase involved in cellulose biosynthesis
VLHETLDIGPVRVRSIELGRRSRFLLLRYRKEGCVVEEQVVTYTQEVAEENLQIEVITDLERFDALAGEWDGLVNRSGMESLFLSQAWLRTWWEAFAGDKQLEILTLRNDGELVGAVPMMRSRDRFYGVKVDSLHSIYNPHTPRFDFITAPGWAEEVYRTVWDYLSHRTDCEMIALSQVPDESPTIPAIERLAHADGWLSGQWIARPSPYIPLGCTHDELLKRLKGGYRYNLRKRYERLCKVGPVDVEVITAKDLVREAMQDGLRIEAAAWKGESGTAIVSDPAVTEFYIRLAERQADVGQLRLSFLRVGGKRISFSYILRSDNKVYGVKIGYDPKFHTYSPGNMLLNLVLQDACANGLAEYDFLGVDDEWKMDWTESTRGHRWLFLFRDRVRLRLLRYLKFSLTPKVKSQVVRICTSLHGRS